MPVKLTDGDRTIEGDTPAEVAELFRLLASSPEEPRRVSRSNGRTGSTSSRVSPVQPEPPGTERERFTAFMGQVSDLAKATIAALEKAYPEGMMTDDVAKAIGIEATKLPPLFRHLREVAARFGFDPDQVLTRSAITLEGRPKSEYRLTEFAAKQFL